MREEIEKARMRLRNENQFDDTEKILTELWNTAYALGREKGIEEVRQFLVGEGSAQGGNSLVSRLEILKHSPIAKYQSANSKEPSHER